MTVYDAVRPREVRATRRATTIEGQWERRPAQRALRPSWLHVLSTLAVLIPGTGRAQVLEDWLMLDSSRAFDYLVTERGFGVADSARPDVFRVTASRMLVRHVAESRDRLVASRASAGRVVDGYQRYASSTWLLDVSCTRRTIVVIEKTDYDDDGSVLDRVRPEVRPQDTIGEWDPRPVRLLIDWTCRHRAAGEVAQVPVRAWKVHAGRPAPAEPGPGTSETSCAGDQASPAWSGTVSDVRPRDRRGRDARGCESGNDVLPPFRRGRGRQGEGTDHVDVRVKGRTENRRLALRHVTTTHVGRAMILNAENVCARNILENPDINRLAADLTP